MRYRSWYNRRVIDSMGFEPEEMRMDVEYGGTHFQEADRELFEEITEEIPY